MQQRSGEAEGSDWRTPAEWDSHFRHHGENKVPAHTEESPAVTQRLLQILKGHFTSVSWRGGRLGSTVLLKTVRNGLHQNCIQGIAVCWFVNYIFFLHLCVLICWSQWKPLFVLWRADLQNLCMIWFYLSFNRSQRKKERFRGEEVTDWEEESGANLCCAAICGIYDSGGCSFCRNLFGPKCFKWFYLIFKIYND